MNFSVDWKYLNLSMRLVSKSDDSYYCPIPWLNLTHFDPPDVKIDFLIFLGSKSLQVEKNYLKFQVSLMAIYDKKTKN